DGILWIGGEGFGLRGFDPVRGEVIHRYFDKSMDRSNPLFIDSLTHGQQKGTIWVASNEGLHHFNTLNGDMEHFALPWEVKPGTDGVEEIIVDDKGDVCVATQQGLVVLSPATRDMKIYRHDPNRPNSLSTNALWCGFQDSKG